MEEGRLACLPVIEDESSLTLEDMNELYSTVHTPMPTPRFRFGATCHDDKIYVAGGFADLETGNSGMSLATTDVYDCAPPRGPCASDRAR